MKINPPKMAAINATGIKNLYFMLVPPPKDLQKGFSGPYKNNSMRERTRMARAIG
jgi:hypothetical protein